MKYRIKKIIRNNGTETYIPQVKKYRFWFWVSLVTESEFDFTENWALQYIKSHQDENQGKKVKKVEIINIV